MKDAPTKPRKEESVEGGIGKEQFLMVISTYFNPEPTKMEVGETTTMKNVATIVKEGTIH